jgi:Xaa-Pro aminopeptidase
MGPRGAACLANPSLAVRNANIEFPWQRASGDMLYLTGLHEEDAILLLLPAQSAKPFVLFVHPSDPEKERWSGPRLGVQGAQEQYGAELVFPLERFDEELPRLLEGIDELYLPFSASPQLWQSVKHATRSLRRRPYQYVSGPRRFHDLSLLLGAQRRVKDPDELVAIQAAVELGVACMRAGAAAISANGNEALVDAAVLHCMRANGARPAFANIIASGARATVLHYQRNDAPLQSSELVLIDIGAELGDYCSDLSRCFPVGGAWTTPQRELYSLVLAAQQAAIDAMVPGNSVREPHRRASLTLIRGCVELGLLHGDPEELYESGAHRRFYPHSTGHFLGIDAHDPGELDGPDGPLPFEAGMVMTVEPGLYIPPDEQDIAPHFRGIGIRIEDDVLVTPEGPRVLSAALPRSPEGVQALVAQ